MRLISRLTLISLMSLCSQPGMSANSSEGWSASSSEGSSSSTIAFRQRSVLLTTYLPTSTLPAYSSTKSTSSLTETISGTDLFASKDSPTTFVDHSLFSRVFPTVSFSGIISPTASALQMATILTPLTGSSTTPPSLAASYTVAVVSKTSILEAGSGDTMIFPEDHSETLTSSVRIVEETSPATTSTSQTTAKATLSPTSSPLTSHSRTLSSIVNLTERPSSTATTTTATSGPSETNQPSFISQLLDLLQEVWFIVAVILSFSLLLCCCCICCCALVAVLCFRKKKKKTLPEQKPVARRDFTFLQSLTVRVDRPESMDVSKTLFDETTFKYDPEEQFRGLGGIYKSKDEPNETDTSVDVMTASDGDSPKRGTEETQKGAPDQEASLSDAKQTGASKISKKSPELEQPPSTDGASPTVKGTCDNETLPSEAENAILTANGRDKQGVEKSAARPHGSREDHPEKERRGFLDSAEMDALWEQSQRL